MGIADGVDEVHKATVARRVLRGYRPHEGYWSTEYIRPSKTRHDGGCAPFSTPALTSPAAAKYAARRSAVARMGIAVLCWADA
jgi:hypothetical protein